MGRRRLAESPVVSAPGDTPGAGAPPGLGRETRLYLQRYWHYELAVAADLPRRAGGSGPSGTRLAPTLADALADQVARRPVRRRTRPTRRTCSAWPHAGR